ncbi:hypothetical protein ACFWG0_27095 [Streptomyces yangpuensis]|uniref:hypothetical protein n=1 Tax=Streptomyces yangpuensis TaxID=1648182 RepID=UPI003661F35E
MFHKELGEIKLSELNLDDLEDRRLWESLYGKTKKGDLECLDCCRSEPGCPQWMLAPGRALHEGHQASHRP